VLDSRLAIGQSERDVWIVLIVFLPLLGYAVLNIVTPRPTLAWQVRSTARHSDGDPRAVVGRSFQRWLGIDPGAPTDQASLRGIRVLGVAEVFLSVIVIVVAYLATS
jgi:hypothetical protein